MDVYKNFSETLRFLLTSKNLTLKAVEQQTGISRARLRRWIKLENKPDAKSVVILAKYFNCRIAYLLGQEKGRS